MFISYKTIFRNIDTLSFKIHKLHIRYVEKPKYGGKMKL